MSKHTPGPWEIGGDYGQSVFVCASALVVAKCDSGSAKANAHLISAAPDMYEALTDLVALVSQTIGQCDEAAKGVAALKKARGE